MFLLFNLSKYVKSLAWALIFDARCSENNLTSAADLGSNGALLSLLACCFGFIAAALLICLGLFACIDVVSTQGGGFSTKQLVASKQNSER